MRNYLRIFAVLFVLLILTACGGGSPEEKLAQIEVWDDQGWTADGELTKLLFDGDAAVRRRAAIALGRINDTLTIDSVAMALKSDSDPSVRAAAAFAFAPGRWRMGTHYLVDAQRKETDPLVLIAILRACNNVYARDAYESYFPLLHHQDPRVRAQAALSLDVINRHDVAADSVVPLLKDEDRNVRWAALFFLARARTPKAVPLAAPMLADTSVSIRRQAYRAIGGVGIPETEDLILQGLKDPDPIVRATVAETFAIRVDTILILKVFPYLETETNATVLEALVTAIGEHWRMAATPYLQKLLDHPDPGVRAAAVKALPHRLDFKFEGLVEPAADDPEPRVRLAYLETVDNMKMYKQQLDTAKIMKHIRKLTQDSVPRVRARAVQSYLTQGGSDAAEYLNKLYNDSDLHCIQMAVQLIGTYRIQSYQDSLYHLYERYAEQWRPELKWAILASSANMSPSVNANAIRTEIFNWGMADPNRLVRWYSIAVWDKFRQDRRSELGTYYTELTPENVNETLHPYATNPRARLETSKGPILVELRPDLAPRTVRRFIAIAQDGIYKNCLMDDIQPGNIVQTGQPRGDGWGLPGETVRDEIRPIPVEAGSLLWLINTRDSGHGAFGIALERLPYLDFRYGIFGTVIDGLDNAKALTYSDTLRTVEILTPGT
jgi:HEAT repeat protein/cyclophilin family peptidyl-prolyl cis-trans isomerase